MAVVLPVRTGQAFDTFARNVSVRSSDLKIARRRVKRVRRALKRDRCVRSVLTSGSYSRRTQCNPIHDVDLIAVFDRNARPDWDRDEGSAEVALRDVEEILKRHLGRGDGSGSGRIKDMELRNRVVECHLDVRDQDGNPQSFAVEIMPSLWGTELARGVRFSSALRAPGRRQDNWITTDPLYVRRRFTLRRWCWRHFAPLARMLRAWKEYNYPDLKGLSIDILVLHCMPRRIRQPFMTRQEALAEFFTAAALAINEGVYDPSGRCGEIQPKPEDGVLSQKLAESADRARRAIQLEREGKHRAAICEWRAIFGPKFPPPAGGCGRPSRAVSTASPESGLTAPGQGGAGAPGRSPRPSHPPRPTQPPAPRPARPVPAPVGKGGGSAGGSRAAGSGGPPTGRVPSTSGGRRPPGPRGGSSSPAPGPQRGTPAAAAVPADCFEALQGAIAQARGDDAAPAQPIVFGVR